MLRYLFLLVALCLLPLSSSLASPIVIEDNYVGGTASDASWANQDVIGDPASFDISKMEVEMQGTVLTVSIYSTYYRNVGLYNTVLGDLFISTDGYNPFGEGTHNQDTAANGEDWELALTLDNHGGEIGDSDGTQDFVGKNGTSSLFAVDQDNIELSYVPDGIYRQGQETQYDSSNQEALALGGWSITDVAGSDYDKLTFVVDLGGFAPDAGATLGLHWNMTCGNDTIEGSYQTPTGGEIPEPRTAALLLFGLMLASCRKISTNSQK